MIVFWFIWLFVWVYFYVVFIFENFFMCDWFLLEEDMIGLIKFG